ncbi:hypothetical protein [Paenibacillus piri]|uniref:Uncharacterized protein n=1 Tax=Paenibacillus piri TaxID=2547395 RepID=A0A4R5K787_9BACL|nr:hypothetical protein [Paenibacillus piri]TDF90588.1 hypothetical protein E1757_33770 [Paenibacillus piri]
MSDIGIQNNELSFRQRYFFVIYRLSKRSGIDVTHFNEFMPMLRNNGEPGMFINDDVTVRFKKVALANCFAGGYVNGMLQQPRQTPMFALKLINTPEERIHLV